MSKQHQLAQRKSSGQSSTDDESIPTPTSSSKRKGGKAGHIPAPVQIQRKESEASSTGDEDEAADRLAELEVDDDGSSTTAAAPTPKKKKKKNKKKRTNSTATNATATAINEDATPQAEEEEGVDGEIELPDESLAPPPPPEPLTPVSPSEDDYMKTAGGKLMHLHREPWGHWSMTDYAAIKVRSADYIKTGIKISPPCPPTMEIVHLEIYLCDEQIQHVCSYKDNWLRRYKAKQAELKGASSSSTSSKKSKPTSSPSPSPSPDGSLPDLSSGAGLRPFDDDFFFVVTFHVQTAPTFHLTMYFQRRDVARAAAKAKQAAQQAAAASPSPPTVNGKKSSSTSSSTTTSSPSPVSPSDDLFEEEYHEPKAAARAKKSFDTLFQRFIEGDTAFRNSRLKLIPFVVDGGNWFVNKAVGNRPCIIGNKITTKYHCDPELNYMEVDIDVSGSRIGSGIFRVVKGYASYLTLDLTLLIEGQELDELPECVLGGCRLRKVDLTKPEVRPPPTR